MVSIFPCYILAELMCFSAVETLLLDHTNSAVELTATVPLSENKVALGNEGNSNGQRCVFHGDAHSFNYHD